MEYIFTFNPIKLTTSFRTSEFSSLDNIFSVGADDTEIQKFFFGCNGMGIITCHSYEFNCEIR